MFTSLRSRLYSKSSAKSALSVACCSLEALTRSNAVSAVALRTALKCASSGVTYSTLPDAAADMIAESPMQLAQVAGAGRGLVASRNIGYGQVVHSEQPLVCVAVPEHSGKVCDQCLRVHQTTSAAVRHGSRAFCSAACLLQAQHDYLPIEASGACEALQHYCSVHMERFPLLAARVACMSIMRECQNKAGSGLPGGSCTGNGIRRGNPLADLRFLSYVNVPPPLPPPWVESYDLLRQGLASFASASEVDQVMRGQVEQHLEQVLTLDWYASVLARFHINSFRVDCVMPVDYASGHSLQEMAASVISGGVDGFSGSAVYLLASMFNHSCMPNVQMTYPGNDATAVFVAARDIAAGEQLCITYIDTDLPTKQRQQQLEWGYGFTCRCLKCAEHKKMCIRLQC